MSSDALAIGAEGVGKAYPVELTLRRILRYLLPMPMRVREDDFWALRDVSFELKRGEVMGVIGRNGSGKSTLLQLVSGLMLPSVGSIRTFGHCVPLLELGAGFNPDFTGRENILQSANVYGYPREYVREHFDEIVAFADIGPHLDQPVKTYSSGMFARLAFAVAMQVKPDILLIDEILSVGDIGFQAKCFQKLEALREEGMSILFVTHDMNALQSLCDRAMLLHDGRLLRIGEPKQITDAYLFVLSRGGVPRRRGERLGRLQVDRKAEIDHVQFLDEHGEPTEHPKGGARHRVSYRVRFLKPVERPVIGMNIKTLMGMVVCEHNSLMSRLEVPPAEAGDEMEVAFDFDHNLAPGAYRVGVGVLELKGESLVPLYGFEALTVETICDRPASGIALISASVSVGRRQKETVS